REAGLLDLALEGALAADVEVADELLGDRRAALDDLARADVLPERTRNALVVDAAVLVEAAILDGDRGLGKPRAHVVQGDRLAVALRRDRAEQASVGGVDERVLADVDWPQAREVAARRKRGAGADPDRGEHDREDQEHEE